MTSEESSSSLGAKPTQIEDFPAYPAPLDKSLDRIRKYYKQNYRRNLIPERQVFRIAIGTSYDIGTFVRLTNSYVLVGGDQALFCSGSEEEELLSTKVICTSLAGCRIVGCLCIGNKNGLLVPNTIYDNELRYIKEELPDSVEVKELEERLSGLGNVIVCNDRVALIHPDLDKESEEIIEDTLQVEVFRHTIANNPLVGSYCVLNNHGGILHKDTSPDALEDLSSLLDLPLANGTVNGGDAHVGAGLVANDIIAYTGKRTTVAEFSHIETALSLERFPPGEHRCTCPDYVKQFYLVKHTCGWRKTLQK